PIRRERGGIAVAGQEVWYAVDRWLSFIVLAQAEADNAAQVADDTGGSFARLLFPMAAIFVLFYFMIILPQKKEQEKARKLSTVKEKDHILTTAGIYGVVTNVQRDTQRVTIRVDEANGTKIKINMSAIAQILSDTDK